jgi:hypothetical protein
MSMHDWSRVDSGTYHNFHQQWLPAIVNRLNAGMLPPGFYAMLEQRVGGPEADILTLAKPDADPPIMAGGTATLARPRASVVERADRAHYARKANRIAVKHKRGVVVAIVEQVSPGNKDTKHALRAFTEKSAELLRNGVHLGVIDPFPPGRYDPRGLHRAIWEFVTSEDGPTQPAHRPLTVAGYQAGDVPTAYVEPFAVGDFLPDLPLFLTEDYFVTVPLEETYQATWDVLPVELREPLEPPPAEDD